MNFDVGINETETNSKIDIEIRLKVEVADKSTLLHFFFLSSWRSTISNALAKAHEKAKACSLFVLRTQGTSHLSLYGQAARGGIQPNSSRHILSPNPRRIE
jgi:hypothetical protein